MKWSNLFIATPEATLSRRVKGLALFLFLVWFVVFGDQLAWAQGVSGVRAFGGGVAPLVRFPGGSLYIDNQGTQGFLYTPGPNFQVYSFHNPVMGQVWSGAVGTMGPQLSIGLIQGANQTGTPLVLPGPPRQPVPLPPIQSTLLEGLP